jgi:hypothetical protein
MLRILRHLLFTLGMVAWSGPCIYLMERVQQVPVAQVLASLTNSHILSASLIESIQISFQAITGLIILLMMLLPAFLYKKLFLN